MDYPAQIRKAAALIRQSRNCYSLTGAGMSTESGIPDFRSPGGIWQKIDPIKTSSVEVLHNNPRVFYEVAFTRFARITMDKPNAGHRSLARLEQMGYLKGLVTQNIDGLHVKAGSQKVWSPRAPALGLLLGCKNATRLKPWWQVELKHIPPTCPSCDNLLRPDVVLFGDSMPPLFYEAWRSSNNSAT